MEQTANQFLGREPVGRLMKKYAVGAVHSNGTTMPTVTVTADEMSSMKRLIEKCGGHWDRTLLRITRSARSATR